MPWSASAFPASRRSRAACSRRCTAAGSGRCGSTPGFGTAEETNARFRYLLEHGQTGLSVAFDLPTQMGYDADDPQVAGEVGKVGVSISSLDDLEQLFAGIPLDKVTTSMTINATAAILLAMYVAVAKKQGVPLGAHRRHDAERHPEGVHRSRDVHLPAAPIATARDGSHRVLRRASCRAGIRSRSAAITSARPDPTRYRSSPSPSPTRSNTWRARIKAGLGVDAFAPQLSFFFAAHSTLLEEVAKFRAARRIWARRHARPLRRDTRRRAGAPLPHADDGIDAHRAAAAQQHRAHRDRGARSRARRDAVAPHERVRRGVSRSRARSPRAPRCGRSRSSPRRPAPRTPSIRSAAPTRSSR